LLFFRLPPNGPITSDGSLINRQKSQGDTQTGTVISQFDAHAM
jgi:hypothetical protein